MQKGRDRLYQFGLIGALAFLGWVVGESALAQIIPDETLGNERSIVRQGVQVRGGLGDRIEGGAQRGANLFHSFQEFNIGDGQRVYFGNPDDVANIFSRVTGGNPSNILGTLGVDGAANLFFLNPNGILFGPGARLDVSGSFVATTADAIGFGEQGFFSATNPEVPSDLLRVDPSAFFFNQINSGVITNQSHVDAGQDPFNSFPVFGLKVPDGRSLLLLGGDVNIDNGGVVAFGGHVELAGVAGTGAVGLSITNDGFDLIVPDDLARANVSLVNSAGIIVSAGRGGSIEVTAQNINLLEGGSLEAGVLEGLGSVDAQAGDITLNAQEVLTIDGNESRVANNVWTDALGNSGDISIEANSVILSNGGSLSTSVFGQGSSGLVRINTAGNVVIEDGENDSYIRSDVSAEASGTSGGIEITANSLRVANGAQVFSNVRGQGNSGQVTVVVNDLISLDGKDANGFPSGLFSSVSGEGQGTSGGTNITANALQIIGGAIVLSNIGSDATGHSGGINVTTNTLQMSNGAQIEASVFGQGSAGSINIYARDIVVLDGNQNDSFIFNNVRSEAIGNTAGINITTGSLTINGASQIQANVSGVGNTGQIKIFADDEIVVDGRDEALYPSADFYPSAIFTRIDEGGQGSTGGMFITTGSLRITNRAQLLSETQGTGNPGDIVINAQDQIFLDNSIIISEVTEGLGVGNGADIIISTGTLELRNGSSLLADTENKGGAGDITVTARDAVILAGEGPGANNPDEIIPSQITSTVDQTETSEGVGEGGTITITAGSLSISDRGFISSSTFGQGNAGEIRISTDSLSLRGGAQVIASTFGDGNAGRVIIDVSDEISISGRGENDSPPSGIFSTVEETGTGNSGGVEITTGELLITERGQIGSYTGNRGNAGDISITARDWVYLINSAIISEVEETGNGNGGDVNLITDVLELRDGSLILADTENVGDAGDISITANDRIVLVGQGPNAFQNSDQIIPSQISSSVDYSGTAVGEGGDISITTGSLSITDEGFIRSATFGQGSAGDISIDANTIQLSDSSSISSAIRRRGVGNGGDIEIQSRSILLTGGSQINALVGRQQRDEQGNLILGGRGRGGDLRINASDSITLSGTDEHGFSSGFLTLTERGASGRAGDIHISTGDLRITNGAIVVASTYNPSPGGDIFIDANDLAVRGGGQIVTSTRSGGDAGLIQLDIADRVVLSGYDPNFANRRHRVRAYIPTTNGQFEFVDDIINNEGANSGIFANTTSSSSGTSGTITVEANSLSLSNRAEISAATSGVGRGGNIEITTGSLNLDDRSRITASTAGQRRAGNITIRATDLNLADDSSVLAESRGTGEAGNITVNVDESLNITDSEIRTSAVRSAGGAITVNAENAAVQLSGTSNITTSVNTGDGGNIAVTANTIQLHDDSDIRTSVAEGQGDGGNITLRASSILAFDDSDIIAATPEGQGGDITFDTDAFFAEDFDPDAADANPDELEENDRADVNATGTEPGTITTPDTSFIQNSLTDLPESAIDPDNLVANSCVVRSQEQGGTFVITGSEGLPQRPGDATFPTYPTGEVRSIPEDAELEDEQSWQMGDPIVEPQNVYQLEDGQVVLSRECS